jgi:putative ABC transport system permease protein
MWKLAFRNVLRHKLRTALTLAAIGLGVAGMVVSGGFVEDILIELREATIHSRLGHIQVYRADYTTLGRRAPFAYTIQNPSELITMLGGLSHVVQIMPRLNFSGLLSNGRASYSIVGEGVDAAKEAALNSFMLVTAGRQLMASDQFAVVLGQGVAQALRLQPGDRVSLTLNTADGALNSLDFEVVGVFHTFSKDFDDHAVRMPLAAAQELVATDAVHSLVFSLDDTAATDAVLAQLRERLPTDQFDIKGWLELADFYGKAVALYQRQFGVLQLIILIMVVLSVFNSVNMTTYERTGEYGTLMALGSRHRHVFQLIVVENFVLGAIGAGLGMATGIILAKLISVVGIPMPPPPNSDIGFTAAIRVVPSVVVFSGAVGWSAAVLGALLPARRAARLPVVEALRQN